MHYSLKSSFTVVQVDSSGKIALISLYNLFRKRQERLFLIQTQILQRLGITGRVANSSRDLNVFSNDEKDILTRVVQGAGAPTPRTGAVTGVNEISSSEIFAERLQSFYPSCSVPNHTDPVLWNQNSDSVMRLYYDISFPRSSESRTEVTAVSAKLRIDKFNDPPLEATPFNDISNYYISLFCHTIQYNL